MSWDDDGQPSGQPSVAAGSADVAGRPEAEIAAAGGPVVDNVAACGLAMGVIAARPVYTPQSCHLCDKPTIYITRSGLSDHATMHHAHWYSAKRDEYIPISEAELEAKRLLIKRNQAHRKFRRNPVDASGKATGRGKSASTDSRGTGEPKRQGKIRHPRANKRSAGGSDPPAASTPTSSAGDRTVSSRRRVCRVDLSQSQVPPGISAGKEEAWDVECTIPSSGESMDMAPPAKSMRPAGFPEAGQSVAPYLPPPVEDDNIVGGMDNQGMAPEIEVDIEQEVEDLNADLITMDRQSVSPGPSSPTLEAALEWCTTDPTFEVGTELDVLTIVPSTQPPSPRTPPHRVTHRRVSTRDDGFRRPVLPLTTVPESTTLARGRGRGILRLPAPLKLARTPASRHRPPPCGTLPPLPSWTIQVPEPPVVEYRALTPVILEQDPEQGNRMPLTPDVFQDVDYRPLTSLWADIVDQEEQAAAAAATAAMSTIIVPPNVPPLVQPTTAPTPKLAATSALLPKTAKPLFTVVTTTSSRTSTTVGTASSAPIPVVVDQATVDTPDTPITTVSATGGGSMEPPATTSASQVDRRPILRLADVAYAVRVTQFGQASRCSDAFRQLVHAISYC